MSNVNNANDHHLHGLEKSSSLNAQDSGGFFHHNDDRVSGIVINDNDALMPIGDHEELSSTSDPTASLEPLSPTSSSATAHQQRPPAITSLIVEIYQQYARTIITILFWYTVSNTTILTTKWLFTNYFPYPLTVTSVSNGTAALWAAVVTFCCYRDSLEIISKKTLLGFVLPIGLCTGMEIACSNLALKLLSVSFGTILKGGGPVFTFIWGLVFGVEDFNLRLIACLLMMAFGIALASLGEGSEFELVGFTLQLLASCLGGLRWAMTHRLLLGTTAAQTTTNSTRNDLDDENENGELTTPHDDDSNLHQDHNHHKMSPLTAILYTSPTTTLFVLPLAIGFEGSEVWNHDLQLSSSSGGLHEILLVLSTMLFVATLVFILLLSEYWLVNATSSLALSVAGVFKELITIGGGLFFFSEHLDFLNVIGFITCQIGILMYVKLRYDTKTEQQNSQHQQQRRNKSYMSVVDGQNHDDNDNVLPLERFTDEPEEVEMAPTNKY